MSLTVEEIQKTLADSMMSMQQQMESERKNFKEKIEKLEKTLEEKDSTIEELKKSLATKKEEDNGDDTFNKMIAQLNTKIRINEKELEAKKEELQKSALEISTLNNQMDQKKQTIMQLECDNKKLKDTNELLQNQNYVSQNRAAQSKEELSRLESVVNEKDKIISEKEEIIKELNEKMKKLEDNQKDLLKYVKEMKEKEELFKKEKEKMKKEQENFSNEMNKLKREVKKEEKKKEDEQKAKIKILEGQEKMITDLLCEYLLKLNNSQYYISIFDLLNKSVKQYDSLKFFNKLNSSRHESMNDIIFNFFDSVKSYFSIAKEKGTLTDFLSQKSFRLAQIEKEDIEIVKKINSIKLDKDANILDLYLKKKELFFKSKEFAFNLLKEKILIDQENDDFIKNYGKEKKKVKEDQEEFLNITSPPLELDVNFDELVKQDYALVKYQVHNVFGKLRELTLYISKCPIFLVYSLTVNCQSLNTIKIEFLKDENEEKNKKNIEILNEMCPKLVTYLKTLTSFSLINLPLLPIYLPDLSASLKNSKIKKLSLINCIQSSDDLNQLILYFSVPNTLTEINLSNHSLNIPTYLSTSLLNYNINKNLTSLSFNNCNLNEEDIKHITNYVVQNTNLLVCDIGRNKLSPLSCSTFGYCILHTTSLETLRINECGINGESLLFLFNGKGSKPIKHLNLNGNQIGDIGLVSLSAFMKSSPMLESIELENCGGTDMGFNSLINTIKGNDNSKMKYVNFHKNNVTKAALDILRKFNDFFKKRKVVFALDKIEGDDVNIDDIHCAMFT